MAVKALTVPELEAALAAIPGWKLRDGKLFREFSFKDFDEAFSFMSRAALLSSRLNHHPEWFNIYNKVTVMLSTHECSGISSRDVEWARAVNSFLEF